MAKGKKLHIHAESADNGGYMVRSHTSDGSMNPSMGQGDEQSATFDDHTAAHAHMGKLMAKHAGAPSAPSHDDEKKHPAYGAFGRGR